MTIRRAVFPPVLLPLFVAIAASVLWWDSTPARAQANAAKAAPPAIAATTTTVTAVVVPIKGTVSGLPESVSFSGLAQLNANVVTDPDFGAVPTVVLSIDLGKVTGVGSSTGNKYLTSSQAILNRRLAAADTVQLTFPFFASGGNGMSSRVGMATFNLSFNVNSMKLTGATAEIVAP